MGLSSELLRLVARDIDIVVDFVVGAITEFHSTLVMNYVAWYGIVALYPDWTMEKKGLIIKVTKNTKKAFAKYEIRGFKLYANNKDLVTDEDVYPHYCKVRFDYPQKIRCLRDIFCAFQLFDGLDCDVELDCNFTWSLPIPCGFASA